MEMSVQIMSEVRRLCQEAELELTSKVSKVRSGGATVSVRRGNSCKDSLLAVLYSNRKFLPPRVCAVYLADACCPT